MSAFNAPQSPMPPAAPRPVGRALVVGAASCRPQPLSILQRLGFACAELDDPYAAMAEVCRRPMVYRALVVSLAGMFREELAFIATVKRRLPHIDVWLTHGDGRLNLLAEAMRLGADGMLTDEGLQRTSTSAPALDAPAPTPVPSRTTPIVAATAPPAAAPLETGPREVAHAPSRPRTYVDVEPESDPSPGEPVLTADELRALLQEQPMSFPPSGEGAE